MLKFLAQTGAVKTLVLVALPFVASGAMAATTWNLVSGCTASNVQSQACALGVSGLTVSAFSTGTGSNTGLSNATSTAPSTNFNSSGVMMNYSTAGIGLLAQGDADAAGPHALDNVGGVDALLFSFTTTTANSSLQANLSNVKIGWSGVNSGAIAGYQDADLSLFAWQGSTAAPSMTATGPSGLVGAGWKLIGNYADVSANATVSNANTSIYSSYWLISAYDTSYGSSLANTAATSGTNKGLNGGNDSFKVLSIAGDTRLVSNKTPEPGSIALMGAALVGFVATRRRKQNSA